MLRDWREYKKFILALVFASGVGVLLFACCALASHSLVYDYLLWNLVLAWVPLIVAARLIDVLKLKLWSSWEAIILSIVWLLFLPNSFYMISDFIHLQSAANNLILYYAVTFTSIIYCAVVIGFVSLYLVHLELRRRLSRVDSYALVGLILASCSVAIYIGRDLRWDSWAVITNPGGVIFDLSDRLIHFSDYSTILATSSAFFILLSSMYGLTWVAFRVIRRPEDKLSSI